MYDPKNTRALTRVQSAAFEKFRTNFSQNDFDHLMYFHVALMESFIAVAVFFLNDCEYMKVIQCIFELRIKT